MHTLSFLLVHSDVEDEEGRPYRSIEVQPLIDGQRLCVSLFDAVLLLSAHLHAQKLDIFTCACGVAGCAGIFEEAELGVTDQTVSWRFPEEPFRERLNPELIEAGQPLTFVFERAGYTAALAQLRVDLLSLEQLSLGLEPPLPVAVAPDNWPDLDDMLADRLDRAAAAMAIWLAKEAAERHRLGQLYDVELEITLANGVCYRAGVPSVLYDIERAQASPAQFDTEVLPLLCASEAALILAVQLMDWEDLQLHLWLHHCPAGESASPYLEVTPPSGWAQATWRQVSRDT
jgi:hypothetical protein